MQYDLLAFTHVEVTEIVANLDIKRYIFVLTVETKKSMAL